VLEREKGIVIQHLFTNALGAPLRHNPKGPFWQTWNRARGTIDRARFKATGEVVWLVPPELPQIAWHPKGKWRPHDFRASAYSCLRRSGVETLDAMALVGHKSLETAKRYNKILPADRIESAKKLAAWHAAAREEKAPVVAIRKDGRQG
jgi:integrase